MIEIPRVIVVSVLHAFTDEMQDARVRVAAGEDAVIVSTADAFHHT